MKNRYREAKCARCGHPVEVGEGNVETERDRHTHAVTQRVTHDECPQPGNSSKPLWAVPTTGRTPGGNAADGFTTQASDTRPHADAVPLNDEARKVENGQ